MKLLVTAGNTQVPIDRVRCLTNIFTGRTGAAIARHAHDAGHTVTLLTSHPEVTHDLLSTNRWHIEAYRTYDDLANLMSRYVPGRACDVLIHCAAVSDYLSGGVYAPSAETRFDPETAMWHGKEMIDRAAGKVKSDEPELWLRLVRAPKLIDRVRSEWGFRGVLVKFKLEVDRTESELRAIAERSRLQSDADLMVANTLEGASTWALIGAEHYHHIDRATLPARLLAEVERLHAERS